MKSLMLAGHLSRAADARAACIDAPVERGFTRVTPGMLRP